MGIYESLGIRRVINADARLTRLGGSLMPEPVLQAMAEAARSYVDIGELQREVGRRLAQLTSNEAAYVCCGAASGLFLTALACIVGADEGRIERLPELDGLRNEILIHRSQRISYDLALRTAGARLVEVGDGERTSIEDLEQALTDRVAAVIYIAGEHKSRGALPLEQTIALAHAHDVPVIVDAAAQLPPPENLHRFTRDLGADLAIFSGGKDLCGPQSSGLILGRMDLVEACRAHGAPLNRLGRPMKVGKEEMVGLLAAVERYLSLDHAARIARFEAVVAGWVRELDGRYGMQVRRDFPGEAGQPMPRALVVCAPGTNGPDAPELCDRLWEGDPRIAVKLGPEHCLYLAPDCLEPGEEHIVAERLLALMATGRR
jgi:L-seryl-tRNA(Ser) seleniumtransferase